LEINGQGIATYEEHVPGWEVYAKYFKIYGDQLNNRFVITQNGVQVFDQELQPGSYLVNLSDNYRVSFREVAYGRSVATQGHHLDPSSVGVYFIDRKLDMLVFDFFKEPPDSMSSRRGSAKRRRYLNLIAEKAVN